MRKYLLPILLCFILENTGFVGKAFAESPTITLGEAILSNYAYYYSSATVGGDGLRTILISFSGAINDGDAITLPATPTGFSISETSVDNNYAKRINLAEGTLTSDIQAYIRGIGISVTGATQSVSITVTTDIITNDTYYSSNTGHYYQYVKSTTSSWISSYNSAKEMTYMGRAGYLATIMSQEEDEFVNSLSGGSTGWLGGTLLENTGTTGNVLFYDGFNTSTIVSTGWYWACGPEKGTIFYNNNSLYPNAGSSHASEVDATNTATYYNWARGWVSYEPNNQTAYTSYDHNDFETCLTTLVISGNTGKHGTSFSWNDKRFDAVGTGDWDAKGYFIEYGNLTTGDDGAGSTSFASAQGTLERPTVIWNGASWDAEPTTVCNAVIDGIFNGTGFSCHNLKINAGKPFTLRSGTMSVGGDLVLKSDATGTASLINNGTWSISGTTIVERYMTKDAWHIITSPVSGQTIGDFLTASSTIMANPNSGYETYRALKDYNESTNLWNGLTYTTASTEVMNTGKGYAVWPNLDGVSTFTGSLLSGDQSVAVTRTGYGWNCIGNPYSSAIKINSVADATNNFINLNNSNLETSYGAIYVWDQASESYNTIRLADETAGYVTSGQGFFVKVKAEASQVSFSSAMQHHNTGIALRSATKNDPCITIESSQGSKKSWAKVYLHEGSTRGLDFGYDAGAFKSGFDIYTKLVENNGVDFSIQSLPLISNDGYTIPVDLETTEGGTVLFEVKVVNMSEGYHISLDDILENQSTELTEKSKTLLYNVSAGTTSSRFCLNVSKISTGQERSLRDLAITTEEGEIIIEGEVKTGSSAVLYNLQGCSLLTRSLNEGNINRISTSHLSKGLYLLELRQDGSKSTVKIVVR
jgi:hypothetical protein